MPNTLATLLHHCLDFAGVFPPASLPVPEALRVFSTERHADSAGLLARFVCPISRLEDLVAAHVVQPAVPALVVSVLPRGGRTPGEFLASLEADLTIIQRVRASHPEHLRIDTVELRVPAEVDSPATLRRLLAAVDALVVRHEDAAKQVFLEMAPCPALPHLIAAIAEHVANGQRPTTPAFGYKLRTGGSGSASAPSAAAVAEAISAAATHGLPMKCTGGLHRPLCSLADEQGAPAHGFVNLLIASALAEHVEGAPADLAAILGETEAEAFTFTATAIHWRGLEVPAAAVTRARRKLLVAFGSCFADTPRRELQKLGWWPETKHTAPSTR